MRRRTTNPTITRRGFIRHAGARLTAAAAGVSLASMLEGCSGDHAAPAAGGEADAPAKPYGPFKMAFQSWSLRHFPEMALFLEQARRLQLQYVELWRMHLPTDSSPEQVEQIKRSLLSAGLEPIAYGVVYFSADHEQNESLFKIGKAMGLSSLTASPTVDALPSLDRLVQKYDLRIAIHNHGPEDVEANKPWYRPDATLEAIQDLDPRIGACVDVGHLIRSGIDPVEGLETLGSRVYGCHLTDFADADGNSRQDVILGEGRLDLVATLAALQKLGFDGQVSIEYGSHVEDPVPHMERSLAAVRQAIQLI